MNLCWALQMNKLKRKPAWLKQIKVIIWDLDGTLYQEMPELKREIHDNAIDLIGRVKGISRKKAEKVFSLKYSQFGSSTKTLIDCGVDRTYVFSGEWYTKAQMKYLKRDERLGLIFKKLKDRRHILNTNSISSSAKKKLRRIGLKTETFEKLFTNADMFGVLKPDPKPFEAVLEYTKMPAKTHLFIGDRYQTDLEPAKKLGMRTCLVWGESAMADISLKTVYEVAELLRK